MAGPNLSDVAIAIETSGSQGSVAVGRGPRVLGDETFDARHSHSVALLPTVDRLVRACGAEPGDVSQVYVSSGPGSFTGLRIGTTFARALALGNGARVVRVSSLEALAQNALTLNDPPHRVAVMLDAKRQHVFAQCFERTVAGYTPIDAADEREPAEYLSQLGEVGVLGEGVSKHGAALARCPQARVLPDAVHSASARTVYQLGHAAAARGEFTPASQLTPIYIRRPEAEERWEKRQAGAGS